MLQISYTIDEDERVVSLSAPEIRIGRSVENDVVLTDSSVSRQHAVIRRDGGRWLVDDLRSTNGVLVNGQPVESAEIRDGDVLKIGIFEIRVAGPPETGEPTDGRPRDDEPADESALARATIVRSLADISADYGLGSERFFQDSAVIRQSKRQALDQAYASQVFVWLTRLAGTLIHTDSDDEVLEQVMAIAFELLPVERGFILLSDTASGELGCELVRSGDRIERRPTGIVPISKTMLREVMEQRVALLTYDALSDRRLAATESVHIHQIRAAMCTPLWSGERIIGVMQLDTPHHTGSFTEPDVDLLATLANYCAVAIERNRHAREAERQRRLRARLERYHSPAVIEEVIGGSADGEEMRRLKRVEATVLFGDIVGFTAFAEQAQPEAVAELMEGYFTHAVAAIFAEGGTLDKFIGDCVMAFFGAPMSQGDHAQRAVRAAIRIREGLDAWNAERRRQGQQEIAVRIGINSGPVVVGDIGSRERVDYTVLGNTVNVAARLEEAVAGPGDIVLGQATQRQLDGSVPVEPLGRVALKGLSRRIAAYRVVRP